MKKSLILLTALSAVGFGVESATACTGITLTSGDGAYVVARTIEWGGSDLRSQYVIVPRGYRQQSLVPGGLLLIQEFILDDNRSGPQHPALFDLNMLVGTPDGQSYTRQELAGFMRNAGLEDIRRLPLDLPQGCGIMAGTVPVGV